MKNVYTVVLLCLISIAGFAQAQSHPIGCLAGEMSQRQYDLHPERLVSEQLLDSFTRAFIREKRANSGQRSGPYVVPVVFHIIHDAGAEDLTDSIIFLEMEHWNQYASATNPELATVVPAFDTLIGNTNVEFRLAQIDPDGHCTNGIERIYSSTTYDGDDNNKQHPWPREKYLNIWVIKTMSKANNSALAYAYYPGSVSSYTNNDIIDGILVMSDGVGRSSSYERPTIAHESGHWMNLKHTWGDTNNPGQDCGDDDVDDTPPTKGDFGSCPLNEISCDTSRIANVQNIMNYSSCHIMFTKGQVVRAQAALSNPISGRSNIWSQANLLATGTDQPLTYPNVQSCAIPVADFAANMRYVCTGQNVKFTDVSWNAEVQSRRWSFPSDADTGTSTTSDVAPQVSFSLPGWKEVTLSVTNQNGTAQKVKSMVYVCDANSVLAPYFEGFEDNTASDRWISVNYDNNNTYFRRVTSAGHYSGASQMLNMYNSRLDGDIDELVSPPIDMNNVDISQMTFSFDYSFATYDNNHMSDSLAALSLYVSKDCGLTWNRLYFNEGGHNLYNAGAITNGPYTPGQADEYWKTVTATIPATYNQYTGVLFKITARSARSANHLYVDNINIGQSTAGISRVSSAVSDMTIQPNPTQGIATLNIMSSKANDATIDLVDMTGRAVKTIYAGQLPAGERNITFDTQGISSGIYLVRVSDGKASVQRRFVKL